MLNTEFCRTEILIDWLQLYGVNHDFSSQLFEYKHKIYGTKHFNDITEIYYLSEKVAELAYNPRSRILKSNTVILKIDNKTLYANNLEYVLNLIITHLKIDIISITRVDLACDFPKLSNSMNPEKFINKFLQNKILKIGRGHFKVVGTQKKINSYEYLRFGSNTSDVSVYMYNKSKELNEVKNKPYIRDNWKWYKNKQQSWQSYDTWRLEFSLKSTKLSFIYNDTGEVIPVNISTVLNPFTRSFIFSSLLDHYFYFVHNNGKSHKIRMRKCPILNILETPGIIYKENNSSESGRMQKIFIRMLEEFNCENRKKNKELSELGSEVLEGYLSKYDMKAWKNLKLGEKLNFETN